MNTERLATILAAITNFKPGGLHPADVRLNKLYLLSDAFPDHPDVQVLLRDAAEDLRILGNIADLVSRRLK